MDPEIIELLKSRCDTSTDEVSHVGLFGECGKYYIDYLNFDSFMNEYCKLLQYNPSIKTGLAEMPTSNIPCVFDFDLFKVIGKRDKKGGHEPLYSDDAIIDIIHSIQDVLKETLTNVLDTALVGTLHEKAGYVTDDGTKFKNGFHIHFPMIFVNKVVYKQYIIPRIKAKLSKYVFFSGKDINTVLDDAPYKTPWLLYGSRKGSHLEPYRLTSVFSYHSTDSDLELLRSCRIYTVNKSLIFFKEALEYYYPIIFSTACMGREVYCVKDALVKLTNVVKVKPHINANATCADIEIVRDLVGMLSESRSNGYQTWVQVALVLHCVTSGSLAGLNLFRTFSSKCPEKYKEESCNTLWDSLDVANGRYSIGTLFYFAKCDNPKRYNDWIKLNTRSTFMTLSPDHSHNDFAKTLHKSFGNEFVCVAFRTNTWFRYANHRWCLTEDGYSLRKMITNHFTPIIDSAVAELSTTESVENENLIKTLKKVKKEFGMSGYKDNVMKECREEFYSDTFLKQLDSNPRIVGFQNGVYDLDLGHLRDGCPDDYISMCSGIEYKEFADGGPEMLKLERYLEQTFPDPEIRRYWLDVYSESFCGENTYKKFFLWTGSGNNGKSLLTSILEKMYGQYSIDLPTSLVTQKRASSNSASPEMARSEGTRVAWLKEPSADEKINVGIIKELTGNDTIYTRGLYKEGHEIKCMFDLTMVCNTPPILENDIAVWNRARIIPFESEFVDSVGDDDYTTQLLKKKFPKNMTIDRELPEYARIMAWYLLRWKRMKPADFILYEPQKVTDSTSSYRDRHNPFKLFIDERVVRRPLAKAVVDEMYEAFKEYYDDEYNNKFPPNKMTFKDEMNKMIGKCSKDKSGVLVWPGYAIVMDNDAVEDSDDF
jgi:P4 family phage/plasmid primase-like protien